MVRVPEHATNAHQFLKMYLDLLGGQLCSPRGMKIYEVEDYQLVLNAGESCLTSFRARKMNLNYAVNEFLWYLGADPYDTSIEKFASMWPKIKQPEGFYYSNYGQYMFGTTGGVNWAVEELMRDKDSRRAAFPFLKRRHCFADNRDMVCTYSMGFRIRQNKLNMSVNMRSNDAIFGTTNDVFCFWMTYKLVLSMLQWVYKGLEPGVYTHKVDSLHVYERHWDMLHKLVYDGMPGYSTIYVPDPNRVEAWELIRGDRTCLNESGEFAKWLMQNSQSS